MATLLPRTVRTLGVSSAASFRYGKLLPGFLLVATLAVGLCATAAPTERISNGDFGSLDGWEALEKAKISEPNSSFKDAYPDNGKSVFLPGVNPDPRRYLAQTFPETERKVRFQFDFRLADDSPSADASWIVTLERAGRPACYVHLSGRRIGVLGQREQREKALSPVLGTWYHFSADVDMVERTISWRVISEGGEERPVETLKMDPERFTETLVDTVTIRQNVAPETTHGPLAVDNISVQEIP